MRHTHVNTSAGEPKPWKRIASTFVAKPRAERDATRASFILEITIIN